LRTYALQVNIGTTKNFGMNLYLMPAVGPCHIKNQLIHGPSAPAINDT
jgi:hypothetical protein